MNNSKQIKEMQRTELSIAKRFASICQQYGLSYTMLGGAMLGAIRHKGFIPWDDDIDFGMPRDDYEKLKNILKGSRPMGTLRLLDYTLDNSHDYPMKLVDTSFEIIEKNTASKTTSYAWIDIFPLDGMPNHRVARRLHGFFLLKDRALLKLSQLSTRVALINPSRTTSEKMIIHAGKFLHLDKIFDERSRMRHLDCDLKKYDYKSSNYVVNFMGAYKLKEMFEKGVYDSLRSYPFEDTMFYGIADFDKYLSGMYGDYMTPPAVAERDKHKIEVKNH